MLSNREKQEKKKRIFQVGEVMIVNEERRLSSYFFYKVVLTRPEMTIRDIVLSVIFFFFRVCVLRMIRED